MRSISQDDKRTQLLAEKVYQALKNDIFDFRLMPGDRFSEGDIAKRLAVSRTPVREALSWLAYEGYVEVWCRSGWQVRAFDFEYFEELYDLRTVLEREAIFRLSKAPSPQGLAILESLKQCWIDTPPLADGKAVSLLDEAFHTALVSTVGNKQMARVHGELTERLRIIRQLDFTHNERIAATYREYALMLNAILRQQPEEAQHILTEHIAMSKAEVRKITLHTLQQARLQPVTNN